MRTFFSRFSLAAALLLLHAFLSACAGELTREAFVVELENLPPQHENVKLVFFADLHLREETKTLPIFEELLEKVNAEDAHFILVGGDVVDQTTKEYPFSFREEMVSYLKKFRSRHGMIFCHGNHELAVGKELLAEVLEREGIVVLDDSFFLPKIGGKVLGFYGHESRSTPRKKRGRKKEEYLKALEEFHAPTEKLLEKDKLLPKNAPLIILSHRPELFDRIDEKENILMLSGHYHGGIVDLPFLKKGQLIRWYQKRKNGDLPPPKYIHGKFEEGRKKLFVTSGVSGGAHSALRINVPREYLVLTLVRKKEKKQ